MTSIVTKGTKNRNETASFTAPYEVHRNFGLNHLQYSINRKCVFNTVSNFSLTEGGLFRCGQIISWTRMSLNAGTLVYEYIKNTDCSRGNVIYWWQAGLDRRKSVAFKPSAKQIRSRRGMDVISLHSDQAFIYYKS